MLERSVPKLMADRRNMAKQVHVNYGKNFTLTL